MKYKIGFIGTGNMGGALARAISNKISGKGICLNNRTKAKAEILAREIGADVVSIKELVLNSKYIMIGIKPQGLADLLLEIKEYVNEGNIFISMAAGKEMSYICQYLGKEVPVIRIMPNMPVNIGEGMTLTSRNAYVKDDDYHEFESMMSASGMIDEMDERLIDKAMTISGCGPAYMYMMLEAMRNAGKKLGLDAGKSLKYATQTMIGSAKLLMQGDIEISKLRESICSPGGTTIEGVKVLENGDFDDLITECLEAAYNRSIELK